MAHDLQIEDDKVSCNAQRLVGNVGRSVVQVIGCQKPIGGAAHMRDEEGDQTKQGSDLHRLMLKLRV